MEIKGLSSSPMEALARISSAAAAKGVGQVRPAGGGDFVGALKQALQAVNQTQNQASELQKQFQLNNPEVSLEETMVAMQKSNISFQALVQVRNKFIAAYHEIMNMQV
jgi:flagellar hook-basal body complex protein FliE